MKIEDVNVGMKVVPHSKTVGDISLGSSGVWRQCQEAKQPYMYVIRLDADIIVCASDPDRYHGDLFQASDLTPCEEKYTCNIHGVTVELIPGKEYWVSAISEAHSIDTRPLRTYVCTIGGKHYFVGSDHIGTDAYNKGDFTTTTWKYAVDPDTYKEPETEMTVEEIAEALRKSGAIKGKLKIKE